MACGSLRAGEVACSCVFFHYAALYTTCMLCGFSPFNIFVLIYQNKK